MTYSNKKIIITGATGLIGKEIILPLKGLGFDIYCLTIDKNNPDIEGVTWINANLFDKNELKEAFNKVKPEYLINFAWATTDDYLTSNINFDFVIAGLELLKIFRENGGKRAIYAGTCFEYEFSDTPLKENDTPISPKTTYAHCKNHLHQLAELYCQNNNISFGWGRIFYVYGKNEHEKRLTGSIIKSLNNNEEVIIKSGKLKKDYMYTKDIAGAFAHFANSQVEGSVNICTGEAISIAEYASAIGKKMGKENLIKFMDEPNNQPPIIVGDNSRLIKKVEYTPKYKLEQALDEILTK